LQLLCLRTLYPARKCTLGLCIGENQKCMIVNALGKKSSTVVDSKLLPSLSLVLGWVISRLCIIFQSSIVGSSSDVLCGNLQGGAPLCC
jgi:hypothetical protein